MQVQNLWKISIQPFPFTFLYSAPPRLVSSVFWPSLCTLCFLNLSMCWNFALNLWIPGFDPPLPFDLSFLYIINCWTELVSSWAQLSSFVLGTLIRSMMLIQLLFFNLDIEQFHLILVVLWVFFSAHRWTLISAPIGSLTIVSYTQAAEDKPVGPSLHQYLFFANLSEALGAKWRVAKVENVPLTLSSQTWWGGTSRRGCDALLSVTHNENI